MSIDTPLDSPDEEITQDLTQVPLPPDAAAPNEAALSPIEEAQVDQPDPPDQPELAEQTRTADDSSTEPLEAPQNQSGPTTVPLEEFEVLPMPQLPLGTVVGERYEVVGGLGTTLNSNTYRVVDGQGYRQCWACGSSSSMAGDVYCVECGAQLTGRYYRLQEYRYTGRSNNPNGSDDGSESVASPLPEAILGNRVPGVAAVYEAFLLPDEGRFYVVWEEAYGRTLLSYVPGLPGAADMMVGAGFTGGLEEPGEEGVLAWMSQAADMLAQLHEAGIAGCALTAGNLLVQPGDRILLLDPSGCYEIDPTREGERPAVFQSDVRNLATELEGWYLAVRRGVEGGQESYSEATGMQGGAGETPMTAADDATGPLVNMVNPSLALSKAREGAFHTAEAFAEALKELYLANRPATDITLWSGRASDVGQVRQVNEDSVLTLEATVLEHEGKMPVGLYVVADGMGGHQNGEVASSIAARTIGAIVNSLFLGPMVAGDPVARDAATCSALLRQAVIEANRRISDLARERHSDLGTTVVAALVVGNQVSVANVGDSRAYLWHGGQATPLTRDHSLVAQLVAAGQITVDEMYSHPRRNEIYRALGDSRLTEADVDIYNHRLQSGDALLVCSDGLWDFVRDPAISATLDEFSDVDPQVACNALVARANAAGGEDNISAILVRVLSA